MFKLLLTSICLYSHLVQSFFSLPSSPPYYVGIKGPATWYEAERACREGVYIKARGKLATWSNYFTYGTKVKAAYRALGTSGHAWVGLNDLGNAQYGGSRSEGDWHFVDGRNCGGTCLSTAAIGGSGLTAWSSGQPNDVGSSGQDCAEIWSGKDQAGNSYGLNDDKCSNNNDFICEFTSIIPTGVGKQDIDNPIINPLDNPSGGNNNYYIMEFTSTIHIILFVSVVLNVILITMVCYLGSKGCFNIKPKTARYSKVNMYATEDEKL